VNARDAVKRALDVGLATVGLVLLSPVIGATALAVRVTLGRPILFRQERPGLGGRSFSIVKFRTMREPFDVRGRPLPEVARLTGLGQLLRRTSLDELPELWNVLKGDMSLVGPRPLLPEYLPLYSPAQARRHEVRPGMTGLAQISGRNALDWEDRFVLDVWYVDHRTLWLDVRILLKTLAKVVLMEGISPKDDSPLVPFRGTRAGNLT